MKTSAVAIAVILLLAGARLASAQRIDFSGSIASIRFLGEGRGALTAAPGVTFHLSNKNAFQVTTDLKYENRAPIRSFIAIYTVQFRRTFTTRDPALLTFVTVGGAGAADWQHVQAVANYPAHTHVDVFPPIVPVFGGGAEYRISRRVALRGDLTVAIGRYLAMAVRGAIGGVVRLGSVPPK